MFNGWTYIELFLTHKSYSTHEHTCSYLTSPDPQIIFISSNTKYEIFTPLSRMAYTTIYMDPTLLHSYNSPYIGKGPQLLYPLPIKDETPAASCPCSDKQTLPLVTY
jgi:hypothetical protein